MNLDENGLPVTINPDGTQDRNDQLQRCGMISTANALLGRGSDRTLLALYFDCQPQRGTYTRYRTGSPDNVSADQLIAALGAWVSLGNYYQVNLMWRAMWRRFGFAQNNKDGLNDDARSKIPDFMLLRALPLFGRGLHWFYPFVLLMDVLLVLLALSAVGPTWKDGGGFKRRGPDDVDDNNTILTLAVCRARMPTPLSWLAVKLYSKFRPWNYGCIGLDRNGYKHYNIYKPVYGALRWYHRAENGGNPEIAELWRPIVDKYFGGSQ